MNMPKLLLGSLVISAVLYMVRKLFATTALAKSISNGDSYDAIDNYIERKMRHLNIPGTSLAIVEDNKIVHRRSFGKARPNGEAPTPQTPFFIGSLTKSFTALAVMQLVEAGKVELDAPVQRHLPWFRVADPQASAQMTVRHLLNQTSGLPASSGEIQLADFDNRPDATERQARALLTLTLTRPVGSTFEYSNSNYNLLGLIVQAASGECYAHYVQNHIFAPLEMSHSYTSPAMAKQNGLAAGHRYWFTIPFAEPKIPIPDGSLPSGQLCSSSEDMAHYLIAHLNGGRYGDAQLLSSAGIDELQRGAAEFKEMGLSFGQYGMGWIVDKIDRTKLAWHNGATPDFAAYMALLPEQKKGVVLLCNANHYWMYPAISEMGGGVTALLAGEQPAPFPFVAMLPWVLRAQLLIPALQIADVVVTRRLIHRWRREPEHRPSSGRKWRQHILLPLIFNLLAALTLIPMLGKTRGYLMLYMPDYAWTARVCGCFSLGWSILRTGLVLGALRRPG